MDTSKISRWFCGSSAMGRPWAPGRNEHTNDISKPHSAWLGYSYGHLLVITAYKWDYTFYKWGYKYL